MSWPDVARIFDVPTGPPAAASDPNPNEYLAAVLKQGTLRNGWFGEWPPLPEGLTDDPPGRRAWTRRFLARDRLVGRYAWAIPNACALDAIAALSPLVEVGAGGGYWARLLRDRGADVAAYDARESHLTARIRDEGARERRVPRREWGGVRHADHRAVCAFERRALLLIWPDWSGWASHTLSLYRGPAVAYIGEGVGGCTAEPEFFDGLDRDFTLEAEIEIPQWCHVRDSLTIWRRRPTAGLSLRTAAVRELERDLRRHPPPGARTWSDANR